MNLNKTLYQIEWTPFFEYFVEKQSSSFPQSFDLSGLFYFADWRQAQQNSQNAERLILRKIVIRTRFSHQNLRIIRKNFLAVACAETTNDYLSQ